MRLSELIQRMLEIAQEANPGLSVDEIVSDNMRIDPEVRMATQPRYPLAHHVQCVTLVKKDEDEADEIETELPNEENPETKQLMQQRIDAIRMQPGTVWIAEGGSVYDEPYAPRAAWD